MRISDWSSDVCSSDLKRIARSRAFRKAVIAAYGGRCAMCGGGATAPDGRSEIEAAHVIPRGMAGADDVRNGLSLCRLHHWAFDNMLLGISTGRMIVRSEEHTSELQSLMRISYDVVCLEKKKKHAK